MLKNQGFSDHIPVELQVFNRNPKPDGHISYRDFSLTLIKKQITPRRIPDVKLRSEIQIIVFSEFKNTFAQKLLTFTPNCNKKNKIVNKIRQKWVSNNLQNMISMRTRLF